MIFTTHKESCEIEREAFQRKPLGLSEQSLFCRLSHLVFTEEDKDKSWGMDWPVALIADDDHGWTIMASSGDPRLTCDIRWADRIIGSGETVAGALEQAEDWAKDKTRRIP